MYTLYHVCGDNIDKGVKSRYMRVGKEKPQEIHYFHYYAVADQVDFMSLSGQVIPTRQSDPKQFALSLLPTVEDDKALRENICELISRVLYQHCDFFNLSFDGMINWHIKHEYWNEMSSKSVVVSFTYGNIF